jgi:hypothetical protein
MKTDYRNSATPDFVSQVNREGFWVQQAVLNCGACTMRAFIAACIAAGILWGVDVEFNDGRYSDVVKHAVKSALPQ